VSSPPIISLDALTAGYGRQPILEKINLTIQKGSFAGLLGANGSGKTTLLKTIAGIVPPISGAIRFSPANAVAGYVPQRESLDSPFLLSSLEIVQMGLCGRIGPGRFLRRTDRAWALDCLRQTGAENLAKKPFAQLSGGQKQKVLIARALAARPDVLLLDEPTAGVDADATETISALLRGLNQNGMTILMANHDLPVTKRLTDTLFWVRRGEIQQGETARMLNDQAIERLSLAFE
jgi:ABC-type Mn2+/Zn2+ transport system ATPase subunit